MAHTSSTRPWFKMKRVWALGVMIAALVALSSCSGARVLMKTASNQADAAVATPSIPAQILPDWKASKASIADALQTEVYGTLPATMDAALSTPRPLNPGDFSGLSVTEYTVTSDTAPDFPVVLVLPDDTDGPVPIIMMESFCPNHNVVLVDGVTRPQNTGFDCGGDGMSAKFFSYFFGRYITAPPLEMIAARGYGVAAIYPSDIYPDSKSAAQRYAMTAPDPQNAWGAVAAWAHQFRLLTSALDADPRAGDLITYGHSRYGKSALVAAAFDPRIDGVIAHQSGTGGASLTRGPDGTDASKPGESRTQITDSYPHWFTRAYADATPPSVDQHHLLALIAPRPVLLGNAKRDVWSDPEGAFRAARAASDVYALYNTSGLGAQKLTDFRPSDPISFWIRPGTHGVVEEDWPAFLDFLDAHFGE